MLAIILSCMPVVAAILSGSLTIQLRGDASVGVFTVIVVYLAGGLIGGGIVGALLPFVRWRVGAAIVGVVAAIPLFTGIAVSMAAFHASYDWVTVAIASVALGGPVGIGYREIFWEDLPAEMRGPHDKARQS